MVTSAYYFYMRTKIPLDFCICISLPLKNLNKTMWYCSRRKNWLDTGKYQTFHQWYWGLAKKVVLNCLVWIKECRWMFPQYSRKFFESFVTVGFPWFIECSKQLLLWLLWFCSNSFSSSKKRKNRFFDLWRLSAFFFISLLFESNL